MDAARLLPWFGGGLMLLPLVLYEAGPAGAPTARVAVYLFLVWFGLILMAAAISRALDPGPDLPPEHPAAEDAE